MQRFPDTTNSTSPPVRNHDASVEAHGDAAASGFTLRFLGGTGTVTGSRYLLDVAGSRLLVDCGLFQGYKMLRQRNWAPFPVEPGSIDAVLLTHAHLDHSGYLPRLTRDGFKGRIWCAPGTSALCRILLPDSASLLEEEAEFANRRGSSKHHPALPLYTQADARACLRRFDEVFFERSFEPVPGVSVRFRRQGHILGAASILVEHAGRSVLFSGDVGRSTDTLMQAPLPPPAADWIVCESTYGDRRHAGDDLKQELGTALRRVVGRGGVAIIPAFAVGRAQLLQHTITQLQAEGTVPHAPMYLNSPMAADVASLYSHYPEQHRLDAAALKALRRNTLIVNSGEESRALNRRHGPMVIVAGSGMVTGGRVLHHLIAFASDPRNAIILCGFQAGGTRGATLAAGGRSLRIFGQDVTVNAEVVQLGAASGHADADELLAWLRSAPRPPREVFLTHGEPAASDALRLRIERELGWNATVPEHLGERQLEHGHVPEAAARALPAVVEEFVTDPL
jgi:metallo-beta-lactamase family protein